MAKRILIVEDDSFFRETICDVLKDRYKVVEAPHGKSACEQLSIQEFDLVISDIQMPMMSGLDLLEWSKKNKPNVPFIIMTGFSTLLETQSAHDLGAKGFISKPFKIADLEEQILSILGTNPEAEKVKKNEIQYCKVSIDEFVSKPKIDFDVYIRLSNTNIVKIANKDQSLPKEQLKNYKDRGIKFLYILKEDFNKLVSFNLDLAKLMKDRNEISPEKKANFMKYTGEIILERTFVDGINKENLKDVTSFIGLTVDTVTQSKDNFDLLNILKNHSEAIYAHSLGVSMYSVLIAKELGFESTVTLYKIAMAGLFHDIGKKEIDKDLLDRPRHLINREDRKIVESHVGRSQEILLSMKSIPSDVIQLCYEHHEDQDGQGYPSGKRKKDQHPLSRIIQCSNVFLETINLKKDEPSFNVANAINHMEKIYEKRIDEQCLRALKKIFNLI